MTTRLKEESVMLKRTHRLAGAWMFGCILIVVALVHGIIFAGTINTTNKYAWAENAGWWNFAPTNDGVSVTWSKNGYLSGYAWAENMGLVKLGNDGGGPYANTTSSDWGVNMTNNHLFGYAWSETCGWINFNPAHSQVVIDPGTGRFDGYAWAENAGWIHFKNTTPGYNVETEPRLAHGTLIFTR